MNKLTAIICFLSEKEEVEKTVNSIRETAGDTVDILLIDDFSRDEFNYVEVAQKYNCRYYYNKINLGPSQSRDKGVSLCETPYFILLDSHIRMYNKDWVTKLTKAIEDNDRGIYSLRCFSADEKPNKIFTKACGQIIRIDYGNLLSSSLRIHNPTSPIVEVPTVFGGCYAASKRYWERIKGYAGLRQYGMEEIYIGLKTFREGGKCYCLTDVEMGHIFATCHPKYRPYHRCVLSCFFNKWFVADTALCEPHKNNVFKQIRKINYMLADRVLVEMENNKEEIKLLKDYFNNIFVKSTDDFINFQKGLN